MKTMKYATLSLALGLAMTATAASASTAVPAPRPPDPATAARTVTLTNHDDGRTVVVHPGDVVDVRLTGLREKGVTWVWSDLAITAPHLLRRVGGGTTPGGDARAVLRAVGRGHGDIAAVRHCVAAPGHVCSHAVVNWKAAVDIR
ncbi:hypothetical protein FHS39_002500 [Streptomyces olivoverticillatus]|uniref:Secreted protein n=1 Tax=Streptomyces olivoverticillatus TaxID=66427 RepID=A0A7W7LNE9_9ACTN|nr:hypothetical protein [Streptomyces olivoverticillatus]MBB4893469.1 hypothetical protein [Streptomyces olivoverticillatus]